MINFQKQTVSPNQGPILMVQSLQGQFSDQETEESLKCFDW